MAREQLGEYRIVREIGRGGMGAVYEGQSPRGERVAIKTILTPADLDSRGRWELVERFMMEARAIRALDHPNVVSVTDVGQDEGEFFMVMEYLDGQSVRQLLDIVGAIPLAKAVSITGEVCAALEYAHRAGVIHRDIKPDNILILKTGITKLTDFGLARIGEIGTHTQSGTMMGTFAYMSPEQARGERLDARSDIFSLGVTFYEMVAGQRPFQGEGSAAVLQAILMAEPPPLPNAPEHVQAAVARCLAKDPAARFASAAEFRQALAGPEEGTVVGRPAVPAPGSAVVTPAPAAPSVSVPSPAGIAPATPAAMGAGAAPPPAEAPASGARQGTIRPGQDAALPAGWFDAGGPQAAAPPGGSRPATGAGSGAAPPGPARTKCACGEMIGLTDAVCWKCGRPNPVIRARTDRQQERSTVSELQELAAQMGPKKKPWWKLW